MVFRSARWPRLLAAGMLALSLGFGAAVARAAEARGPRVGVSAEDPDNARVIVKYRSDSALARAAAGQPRQAAMLGRQLALASMQDGHVLGRRTQSLRARGLSSSQLATRLAALPDVEWAVPARRKTITGVLPDDPYFADGQTSITPTAGQWYLRVPDATRVSAVNAVGAWAITTGSTAVTVAVLDTGVRLDHPDLAGKLHPGYDFVSRTTTSADGDGRDADPSDPGDWSTAADSCGAANSSWHGTQVAGLIGAASDNGIGMAGLGRNVMVLPVRVLGKCGGYDDDIIAAMRWAGGLSSNPAANAHPARVLNLSLGSSGACSAAYRDAIAELTAAGVSVVVAAGNDTGHAVNEPANCPGAIAVSGLRHAGTKVGYSNLGPEVAIAAPAGNCVNETGTCLYPLLTTTNASKTSPGANIYSDGFTPTLGTSFASPMVAGTVGLMLSVNPSLTPAQIRNTLQATARPFPTTGAGTNGTLACAAPSALEQVECYCTTGTCGAGLLDAAAAVARTAASQPIAPVAVFAASTDSPTVGSLVTLDAGPSSSSVVAYQWTLATGSAPAHFVGGTDGRTAVLTADAPGGVVVSLRAANASGLASVVDKTLTASLAPTASLVVAIPNTTVGAPVRLDGGSSVAAPGRTITSYLWSVSGVTRAHFTSAIDASTATIVADAAGSDLTVTLKVTDSTGDSKSVSQTLAVGAAPAASISLVSTSPVAGASLVLDGGASSVAAGHAIASYEWTLVSGGSSAELLGSTTGASATLLTKAPGEVVIRLAIVDDAGAISTVEQSLVVAVPPVVVTPSSSGGGGALGWGWIAGLAAAVLVLARSTPVAAGAGRRR